MQAMMPFLIEVGKSNPSLEFLQTVLREAAKTLSWVNMKFTLAIAVFVLFAFFISWGVILMMHGSPWLLIAAVGVFLGTFIKYGCQSH